MLLTFMLVVADVADYKAMYQMIGLTGVIYQGCGEAHTLTSLGIGGAGICYLSTKLGMSFSVTNVSDDIFMSVILNLGKKSFFRF